MTLRRRIVGWDEHDAYSPWRRVLSYDRRPAVGWACFCPQTSLMGRGSGLT